jgi:hypothetical protein
LRRTCRSVVHANLKGSTWARATCVKLDAGMRSRRATCGLPPLPAAQGITDTIVHDLDTLMEEEED